MIISKKVKYQPTPTQASMLYDACKHIAAARAYFRDLAADNTIPHFVTKVCSGAKEMVRRMNPKQQDIIENICIEILNGEEIKIEKI